MTKINEVDLINSSKSKALKVTFSILVIYKKELL